MCLHEIKVLIYKELVPFYDYASLCTRKLIFSTTVDSRDHLGKVGPHIHTYVDTCTCTHIQLRVLLEWAKKLETDPMPGILLKIIQSWKPLIWYHWGIKPLPPPPPPPASPQQHQEQHWTSHHHSHFWTVGRRGRLRTTFSKELVQFRVDETAA